MAEARNKWNVWVSVGQSGYAEANEKCEGKISAMPPSASRRTAVHGAPATAGSVWRPFSMPIQPRPEKNPQVSASTPRSATRSGLTQVRFRIACRAVRRVQLRDRRDPLSRACVGFHLATRAVRFNMSLHFECLSQGGVSEPSFGF